MVPDGLSGVTTDYTAMPLVAELSAAQVEEWLHRQHGWARKNVFALGGYRDHAQYRFPVHGIVAWQRAQAEAYAEAKSA